MKKDFFTLFACCIFYFTGCAALDITTCVILFLTFFVLVRWNISVVHSENQYALRHTMQKALLLNWSVISLTYGVSELLPYCSDGVAQVSKVLGSAKLSFLFAVVSHLLWLMAVHWRRRELVSGDVIRKRLIYMFRERRITRFASLLLELVISILAVKLLLNLFSVFITYSAFHV
jgi:hypothetical protein